MSYDVDIGSECFNYTYNVSKLFHDHIRTDTATGVQALNGLTGKQACAILNEAFERLNLTRHMLWSEGTVGEPTFCARYDAENGWGSAIGGLIFLAQIMAACAANPRARVLVC